MIVGKNINLRLANKDDAEFINKMRTNGNKNRYLSSVDHDVEKQKKWIEEYKKREIKKSEYYFIIQSKDNEKLGLVRIYDLTSISFSWGSWLIKENAPRTTAIESALLIYEFAFYTLRFEQSHFDVRKENRRVNAFHQRFGAQIINEDKLNYYYTFKKTMYEQIKQKYKRFYVS